MKRAVVFVLGGPGVGKGTQCSLITRKFFPKIQHFSAGELLRQAANSNSREGKLIRETLSEGSILPGQITVGLLKKAITASKAQIVLIDGFPRAIDQGQMFEKEVTPCEFTLFLDAPHNLMNERLIQREKDQTNLSIQRSDDNEECREKRFKVHYEQCMPVVQYYAKQEKLVTVPASGTPKEINNNLNQVFEIMLKQNERNSQPLVKRIKNIL